MTPRRINIYTCKSCKHEIVTEDVDQGVTPFLIACKATPGCIGEMVTSFYRVPPDVEDVVRWEWYRPPADVRLGAWERQHVENGGLILRRRAAA